VGPCLCGATDCPRCYPFHRGAPRCDSCDHRGDDVIAVAGRSLCDICRALCDCGAALDADMVCVDCTLAADSEFEAICDARLAAAIACIEESAARQAVAS